MEFWVIAFSCVCGSYLATWESCEGLIRMLSKRLLAVSRLTEDYQLRFFCCSLVLLFCVTGCSPSESNVDANRGNDVANPQVALQMPIDEDDVEALFHVEAAAQSVRRDAEAFAIDVDFRGGNVTPQALVGLSGLRRLRAVRLGGTGVGDEACAALGVLPTLEDLDLRDCPVSDAGLASLVDLPKLKALRLSGKNGECSVSDDGMEHVGKIKSLKVLAIDFLWVSEEGLEKLKELKELQELYLAGTTIGNDAIGLLSQHPKLRKVRLAANQIDAEGLALLGKLTQLETLDLSECLQVTDQATTALANLKNLKDLNLWRVNLSDDGIAPIGVLTALERLNLDNTRLSDEGLGALAGLTELRFLHLGSTLITDAGLVHLEQMSKLEDLIVTRTAVTQEGVDALQAKLPKTKIQLRYLGDQ